MRLLRGVTIADPPLFERGKGDPPTFQPGDVVEVSRVLAQELVGNAKAEFVSGTLVEPAPYEAEFDVVTADAAPPETAMKAPARRRKAG